MNITQSNAALAWVAIATNKVRSEQPSSFRKATFKFVIGSFKNNCNFWRNICSHGFSNISCKKNHMDVFIKEKASHLESFLRFKTVQNVSCICLSRHKIPVFSSMFSSIFFLVHIETNLAVFRTMLLGYMLSNKSRIAQTFFL